MTFLTGGKTSAIGSELEETKDGPRALLEGASMEAPEEEKEYLHSWSS
jgi:hypothetical protein